MQIILRYSILILSILTVRNMSAVAQEELDQFVNLGSDREKITSTFKSGNLINIKTTETIHKKELDFRVDHRFGDIAGSGGGPRNFFGLDNASDIRIGLDYGLLDNLNIGIARAKGAGVLRQLYEANIKFRFLDQTTDDSAPMSVAVFSSVTISAMSRDEATTSASHFGKFTDRMSYVNQLVIARKFSSILSMTLLPTYIHRNFTAYGDQHDLFAIGIGGRLKVSNRMAIVADYMLPFRNKKHKQYREAIANRPYRDALGIGLEIETGGHVFHLNFTNATAVQESQFISETTTAWRKGEFRWGFSIARRFSFNK